MLHDVDDDIGTYIGGVFYREYLSPTIQGPVNLIRRKMAAHMLQITQISYIRVCTYIHVMTTSTASSGTNMTATTLVVSTLAAHSEQHASETIAGSPSCSSWLLLLYTCLHVPLYLSTCYVLFYFSQHPQCRR